MPHKDAQWKHKDAYDYATKLEKKFGKAAEYSESQYTWKNIAGFKKVVVLDESVPHAVPMPHKDFVYSTMDIKVPEDKIQDLAKASASIMPDRLKGEVTARCGALIKNAVSLGFVQDVVAGNVKDPKKEYAKRIKANEVPKWYKFVSFDEKKSTSKIKSIQDLRDRYKSRSA